MYLLLSRQNAKACQFPQNYSSSLVAGNFLFPYETTQNSGFGYVMPV